MEKLSRIYVAGHRGLVGSAICRAFDRQGYDNLLLRTRAELDLTDSAAVKQLLREREAGICLSGRSKGRWHSGEQHLPRRLHSRESLDSDKCHRRQLPSPESSVCFFSDRVASIQRHARSR